MANQSASHDKGLQSTSSKWAWAESWRKWLQEPGTILKVSAAGVAAAIAAGAAYCYLKAEYRKALSHPDASTFMGRMALRFMMQHHGKAQAAMIEALPGDLPQGSIVEVSHSHAQTLPTRTTHTAHHHVPTQLGFGHGEGLKLLLDKYPHRPLIGVDVSESMVELVSAWPQAQGPSPRLRAAVGDPCAGLSLEEGSVALSFNMNCVYFWSDLEAGARELYRVAAPGGVAVTVTHPYHVVRLLTLCSMRLKLTSPRFLSAASHERRPLSECAPAARHPGPAQGWIRGGSASADNRW